MCSFSRNLTLMTIRRVHGFLDSFVHNRNQGIDPFVLSFMIPFT
jgi:hypothetical protein